ncbi:MAG: hypothetical protein Homavirus2_7 [Homavirus sp.]|uniref:Uncharacterized protein n=1 Tax=Homavirus sp. TaxID=2487769 RepID=A0A3G5A845_9VIRU|nr:MAG: hypothetical protein Homavirus2_7 [Homavirus sp.]
MATLSLEDRFFELMKQEHPNASLDEQLIILQYRYDKFKQSLRTCSSTEEIMIDMGMKAITALKKRLIQERMALSVQ